MSKKDVQAAEAKRKEDDAKVKAYRKELEKGGKSEEASKEEEVKETSKVKEVAKKKKK